MQEDIDNGKQKTCDACPIALAIKRHFGIDSGRDGWSVEVYATACAWNIGEERWSVRVKNRRFRHNAEEFIRRFDNDDPIVPGPVEPCVVTLTEVGR